MSTTSKNLGLSLTNSSESEILVLDWIDGISGYGKPSPSNMEIIDTKFGELENDTDNHISNNQIHVTSEDKTSWNNKAMIYKGYYNGTNFYEDEGFQTLIPNNSNAIYYDLLNNMSAYLWNTEESKYILSSQNIDTDYGTWGWK